MTIANQNSLLRIEQAQPSLEAYTLVESSEGRHRASYRDGGGKLTAGVGHTGPEVIEGKVYSEAEINAWFHADMEEAAEIVRKYITAPVTQGMFDALTSFAFNFGEDKFRKYTLKDLINRGAHPTVIASKWLEYIYTINDEDGDGDQDAVVDRGLPIRRLREILMARGFSWQVIEGAANSGNIHLSERNEPWRNGGFKEVLINARELMNDTLDRARNLAALFDEPDDSELLSEAQPPKPAPPPPPPPEPKPEPVEPPMATEIKDPTPETPITPADLNYIQYVKLGGKKPFREFSLPPEKLKQVKPHYDPKPPEEAGSVDMSKTTRFKGEHKRQSGVDMQKAGAAATAAATALTAANKAAEQTDSLTSTIIGSQVMIWIVLGLLGFAGVYFVIGAILRWYGANQKFKGEAQASQYMH